MFQLLALKQINIELSFYLGMKVKKVAVGVTHSIVLLENGNVYGWGKKEYAHPAESDVTGKIPELVSGIKTNNICGVACGVTQVGFHKFHHKFDLEKYLTIIMIVEFRMGSS